MILLNFSHPLTREQIQQVEELLGRPMRRVISAQVNFDQEKPFAHQVRELVDSFGFSLEEWQTEQFLIVPPALSYIAVLLLAELHGRMGYFPPHLRLRPSGSFLSGFKVAEILDLQKVREKARRKRGKKSCS